MDPMSQLTIDYKKLREKERAKVAQQPETQVETPPVQTEQPEGTAQLLIDYRAFRDKRLADRMAMDVEDIVTYQAADGFLKAFSNILNVPNVVAGVTAQALAVQGLAHKNHVRTGIMSGIIKVPDDLKDAVAKANDDQFIVDYAPQKGGYKLLGDKLRIRVVTGYEDEPAGLLKRKTKKKPVIKEYTLSDYDVKAYYDWLKEEDEEGKARWKRGAGTAFKAGYKTFLTDTPQLKREGKQRIADFTSTLLETAVPGTPQYTALGALGFAGDVALPSTLEFMPLVSKGAGKAIIDATEVDKAVAKATDPAKVQVNLSKAIINTPAVQAKIRRVSRAPVIGQIMDMFGVRTKELSGFESLVTESKVITQAKKQDILNELVEAATKIAPQEAKGAGKIFEPTIITEQRAKFADWVLTRGGSEMIQERLRKGKTLDALFDDPKLLAQIYDMPEEDVMKYVGYHDMRQLHKSLENPEMTSILGDKTAKSLRNVLDQVEQVQRESGVQLLRGTTEYVPRKGISSQRYPGAPVRATPMKPESFKRRTTTTFNEWEKSIFTANKGIVPDYNVFQVIAEHAEDAINYSLQKTVEDGMVGGGIARKLVRSDKITSDSQMLRNVREAIKKGGKGDIMVSSPRAFENARRTLIATGQAEELADWNVWYPVGRIRFYLDQSKDALTKALKEATEPWKRTVGKTTRVLKKDAEALRQAIGRVDSLYERLNPEQMDAFLDGLQEMVNDKVVQKYAKGTIAVTGRVPAYLVDQRVHETIKAVTKAMYSPEIAKIASNIRRFHRPFAAMVTTWNPGFWYRFNAYNPLQMMNSGMELPMVPVRRAQGIKVLAKKGTTVINGTRIPNERVYDALKGSLSTFQGSVGANDYKLIMHGMYDIFGRQKIGRFTKQLLDAPGRALDAVDGMDRLAVGIDHVERIAVKQKITSESELLRLLRTEGAEWSRNYMYDYPNVPEWVRKASTVLPFIRFYYKAIPDQMRMMFKFGLMHDVFAGKRSLQNAVGIPETPMEYEYLKKSQNIKFKDPETGNVVAVDLSWPFEQMFSIESAREFTSGPMKLMGPVAQLPFHIMGMRTFPRLEPYGTTGKYRNPRKIDAPAYFIALPKEVIDNPKVQDVMGFNWRVDGDTGQKILQMNQQALDIWHDFNPWYIPLYNTTKNSKIILSGMNISKDQIDEWAQEQNRAIATERMLNKKEIEKIRPYGKTNIEKMGLYTKEFKIPGVVEYDPALMLWDQLNKLDSLLSRQDITAAIEVNPRGYSVVDPKAKMKEIDELNKLLESFILYQKGDWNYRDVGELQRRVQNLRDSLKKESILE